MIQPPDLYHRVAAWPEPFDPPPTSPPLGTSTDLGHRYDAPDASWLTLYTAGSGDGAFGEKLAYFRFSQGLEQKIDDFLEADPDQPEPPSRAELGSEDVDDWTYGTAEANQEVWLIDVMHPHTHEACWPALRSLLAAYGHHRMDNGATLSPNRLLTRQIAGHLHELAVATIGEGVAVAGLRFESSLWSEWECFALWEPLELAPSQIAPVSLDDDDLRSAAAKLNVHIA